MKKIICGALALMSVFCMAGCQDTGSGNKLTYGKKYVYYDDIHTEEAEQNYYIFYKNGTAKYHYYDIYQDYTFNRTIVYSYNIKLKYKIVEEENTVFCFYDGIEYDEIDTAKTNRSEYTAMLMYTEDFLVTSAGDEYMTEAFASEIPNFGKNE